MKGRLVRREDLRAAERARCSRCSPRTSRRELARSGISMRRMGVLLRKAPSCEAKHVLAYENSARRRADSVVYSATRLWRARMEDRGAAAIVDHRVSRFAPALRRPAANWCPDLGLLHLSVRRFLATVPSAVRRGDAAGVRHSEAGRGEPGGAVSGCERARAVCRPQVLREDLQESSGRLTDPHVASLQRIPLVPRRRDRGHHEISVENYGAGRDVGRERCDQIRTELTTGAGTRWRGRLGAARPAAIALPARWPIPLGRRKHLTTICAKTRLHVGRAHGFATIRPIEDYQDGCAACTRTSLRD